MLALFNYFFEPPRIKSSPLPTRPITNDELVDKIMAIEPLFKLSMSESKLMNLFLAENPRREQNLKDISLHLKILLDVYVPGTSNLKRAAYLYAFNQVGSTNGYSLLVFLNNEQNIADFFRNHIQTLETIYSEMKPLLEKENDASEPPKRKRRFCCY